ncbi:MAG TPA: nucleotidyltransferase domain-containing protein [Bryobacteraceae bacterium]|nr:nucleotidyltransferase domain-containing protein [Bryobacteraceae bacterium]
MDREQVIARLRTHEVELKNAGILRLSLFGSVARGEPGNDVDLMADFDGSKRLSLLDMVGLENRLAEILGIRVDLSPTNMLKEPVRERAANEAVVAF